MCVAHPWNLKEWDVIVSNIKWGIVRVTREDTTHKLEIISSTNPHSAESGDIAHQLQKMSLDQEKTASLNN